MNWKVQGWIVALLLMSRTAHAVPSLLETAQKVCDASKWTGQPVYLWISENKVVSWQAPLIPGHRRIERFTFKGVSENLGTGKQKFLIGLNKRLAQIKGALLETRLSPDAKWVLVLSASGGDVLWSAISLDGSKVCNGNFGLRERKGVAWNTDSLHWFELAGYSPIEAVQYGLFEFKDGREIPLAGVASFDRLVRGNGHVRREFVVDKHKVTRPYLVGVASAGRVLIALSPRDEQGNFYLWDVGLGADAADPRLITISLPQEARLEEAVLSPNGDRIAWRLKTFQKPPTGKGNEEAKLELWVSKVDGSDMHLLGAQPVPNDDSTYDYCDSDIPCRLQWVPGGKRLSFIYKNALYTVPAD